MSTVLIRGGTVIAPTGTRRADVVIENGVVVAIGDDLRGDEILDAGGCFVAPGLVDLHTHLREPGKEEAETVESGSRAAALGGYTAVVAMPNTTPAIDNAAMVRDVLALGQRAKLCHVYVSGAITVGRKGEQLAPMAEMAALGVHLFTDDGTGVQDTRLMRRAMEYATGLGVTLAQHCEDSAMANGGHMHEGEWSSRLGIPGQPAEAEELMVMRDLALARLTGATVHFQHLSTAGSVEMVRIARAQGVKATAEATPHHFTLTDAECASFDPVFKVNPPLRTSTDRDAVKAGLHAGVFDAIATDHAPHLPHEKEMAFDQAPPGMLGLETALALALTELNMSIEQIVALMSTKPAAVARIAHSHGSLAVGRPAHICVIDPHVTWTVRAEALASLARNTPFAGRELRGKVRHTIFDGVAVVVDGIAQR